MKQKIVATGKDKLVQDLAQTLTSLRKETCLSQEQVAKKLGMASRSHIAAIEAGKISPRIDTLIKLLSLYECTLTIRASTGEVVLSWSGKQK